MIQLVAKSGIKTYTHYPTPEVLISRVNEYREGTAETIKASVTWEVNGILIPGEQALSISEQVNELVDFYTNNTIDSLQLKDGTTILAEMPTGEEIKVSEITFPKGSGPEWATKREYHISFKGVEYPEAVETAGDYEYTITYSYAQSGIGTRTINCTLRDYADKNARAKLDALVDALGWLTWPASDLQNKSYTEDKDNTTCTFTCTHKQHWAPFPTGITDGQLNSEISTDSQGVVRRRYSGWFEGTESACNNAIADLKPGNAVLISRSVSRDAYSNRSNFALEYIVTTENDILQAQESLTIQGQIYDYVWKRVLGGFDPVKQNTGKTIARATQTGTIKKLNSYANAPAYAYDAQYLKSVSITKTSAEIRTGSGHIFTTNYTYEFEFPTTPNFP